MIIETDSEDDDNTFSDDETDSDEAPNTTEAGEQVGIYTDEGFEEEA